MSSAGPFVNENIPKLREIKLEAEHTTNPRWSRADARPGRNRQIELIDNADPLLKATPALYLGRSMTGMAAERSGVLYSFMTYSAEADGP